MPTPIFPTNIFFEYPVRERANWKTLVARSEGGVEQRASKWLRPIREWELGCTFMERSAEADVVKNFFHARKGTFESFLFIVNRPRTYEKEYVGIGDGSRRVWRLPFKGYSFLTMYQNGAEKLEGVDYDTIVGAGPAGGDLLVWRTAPAAGVVVEADGTDAILIPLVRLSDDYEDEYVRFGRYNARYRFVEDKADVDPYQ